jgi:hypothetical protein
LEVLATVRPLGQRPALGAHRVVLWSCSDPAEHGAADYDSAVTRYDFRMMPAWVRPPLIIGV